MRPRNFAKRIFHLPLLVVLLALAGMLSGGCVYFNTFYNARQAFKSAEKSREQQKQRNPNAKGNKGDYDKAIEKSLKVVENHPNSKYYDDALYILGVSYYYTDEYAKSERRMREIIANYPDSKYRADAELYIAKSMLALKEYDDAMASFQHILQDEKDKKKRAEAARALAFYYYNEKQYLEAQPYFFAIRDSLGEENERVTAQEHIADTYFEMFRYGDALSSYLQMLGMKPGTDDKYHALSRAALCAYRLQRIDDGIDYLNTLVQDPLYFDSIGVLKLRLAEGNLRQENLPGAENVYQDVIDHEKNPKVVGEAFYQMGIIAQFDYDDLTLAKQRYDTAFVLLGRTDIGQDAFQRGVDIGKLGEYRKQYTFDSTSTEAKIEQATETQLLLADLYWSKLNKPDSALYELRFAIDSIPENSVKPEVMIQLASLVRDYENDTTQSDSILQEVLTQYPHDDEAGRAIELLGLTDTPADTGYAEVFIRKAERCIVEDSKPDSARYYFQQVVDRFPESKYFDQANFARIWIEEEYFNPGDSTVYYAYQEFVDSFPGSQYVTEARSRLAPGGESRKKKPEPSDEHPGGDTTVFAAGDTLAENPSASPDTSAFRTNDVLGTFSGIYIGPNGDTLELLKDPSILEIKDTFAFPQSAQAYADPQYQLYYQIKLDFSGKVEDYVRKNSTNIDEIDEEADKTIASMTFNITSIPDRQRGKWVVYKYNIVRPDFLR